MSSGRTLEQFIRQCELDCIGKPTPEVLTRDEGSALAAGIRDEARDIGLGRDSAIGECSTCGSTLRRRNVGRMGDRCRRCEGE